MEIGRNEPTADASGFLTMLDPLMTAKSFQSATVHNLTTDNIPDLSPQDRAKLVGGSRVALIRVSDAEGNWEQIVRRFRTLERKVTIEFHTVDVQSIGEPASETEGEMGFQLEAWDHDGENWSVIRSFVFENHAATLAPFSVRDFVLDPVVVVGPRPVNDGAAGVAFHVREFDDWPFADENTSSLSFGAPRTIRVVPGENNEDKPLDLTLRAEQPYDPLDPEESLIVDVRVSVKVEHVAP
jgi:hypothetical protein